MRFNINIHPNQIFPALKEACPLKDNCISNGVDIQIFRELSRDIYFGEHKTFTDEMVLDVLLILLSMMSIQLEISLHKHLKELRNAQTD